MTRLSTFIIAHDHFEQFKSYFITHYKFTGPVKEDFSKYVDARRRSIPNTTNYELRYADLTGYLTNLGNSVINLPLLDTTEEVEAILNFKFLNIQEFLKVIEIFSNEQHILGVNIFRCREELNSELCSLYSIFNHAIYLSLDSILNFPTLFKYSINHKDLARSWFISLRSQKSHMYSPSMDYTKKPLKVDVDSPKAKFDVLQRNLDLGVQSLTNLILENKNYTFGLEIETSEGLLNENDYNDLNVICVYDGSLKAPDGVAYGGEYVTGVLRGDAGINQIRRIVNKLIENNCKVNNLCSIHLHIGSANFNKENLLAMYKLGILLEDELFSMMPISRRKNVYCTRLERIFNNSDQKLLDDAYINSSKNEWNITKKELKEKTIDYLFDLRLFNYVRFGKNFKQAILSTNENNTKPAKNSNKLTGHPSGNKCGYDKNAQRYSWLNFVTCLFNNKGVEAKTLEFRLHSGTLNFKKILAWLKICVAFTWFAETHQDAIFRGYYIDRDDVKYDIDLSLILRLCYPNSYELLIEYVKERISIFNSPQGLDAEVLEYQESLNLVKSFKLKELITLSK